MSVLDPVRLAFGTLSVLPVRPPTVVDRRVAGWAMTLAPLAGLVLALLVAVPLALAEEYADAPPLLLAVLVLGALALLTRGMHLDGLADVADGLGSGRRGEAALAIMKRSDIGPFGVVTLVLVLLLQASALAACIGHGTAAAALTCALVLSRMTLTTVTRRFPAARPDGLGRVMAGAVSLPQTVLALALSLGIVACVVLLEVGGPDPLVSTLVDPGPVLLFLAAPLAGTLLASRAVARFGGATGDVYGAAAEATLTAILVAAALAG